jgi:hypothetical protein
MEDGKHKKDFKPSIREGFLWTHEKILDINKIS